MSTSYNEMPEVQNDDHHESNHEFNMFLDREIQKKLLNISESDEVTLPSNNNIIIQASLQSLPVAKRSNRYRFPKSEEFCSWNDSGKYTKDSFKRNEKSSKLTRDRESSHSLWKDFKPKEIHYMFKHYGDSSRYIEQYRYDHTYNFGPLSREPIEITTCKIVPLRNTPSPNYKLVSESEHHNPFRRSKDFSHSLTNIHPDESNGISQTKKLPFVKSETNFPDVSNRYRLSPTVVKHSTKSTSQEVDNTDTQSIHSNTSSQSEDFKVRSSSRVNGIKSSSTYKSIDSKSTKASNSKSVSLDKVQKMSPLHILQVKKSGEPLNTGLPLFQGKTMKVAKSSGAQSGQENMQNGKKNGQVLQKMVLPTQNLKTLDVLSSVSAVDPHQEKDGNPDDKSEANENVKDSSEENKTPGSQMPPIRGNEASAVVREATLNLKQGTDKENYQSLISELSYLDISTTEENANKPYEIFPSLDVTGLTVSFAQKYDIKELSLGNSNNEGTEKIQQNDSSSDSGNIENNSGQEKENLYCIDLSEEKGSGKNGVKVLGEVNENSINGNVEDSKEQYTNRSEVHLEKFNKFPKPDQKQEEIQTIKEITTRLNKMKEAKKLTYSNGKGMKKHQTQKIKNLKQQLEQQKEELLQRQKSRVTFNMNPEIIDITEDDDAIKRLDVSSPDVMKPVTLLPYLDNGSSPYNSVDYSSTPKTSSRHVREVSPDKASIMRRYFIDIAQKEGDRSLIEKLQNAPDYNFKPLSAGDAQQKNKTKYRVSLDELQPSRDEKALSSPCGTYMYSPSPTMKPTFQHYSKIASTRAASRQKSFYNTKPDIVAESDKRFLKDINKLSKLKEIYLKSREKSNGKIDLLKDKPKQNVSVLRKMQSGQQEIEGMWFDSSGRAYVSLATRYDPVRK